ncbi:hypothetical protein T45_00526 [Streptomyces turgidiscabies]|nr:hypothetical protein T45_00526 [Streptomyces turgidiscabies]
MSNAHEPAWTPEPPYVSGCCTIGTHDQCRDGELRESGVQGLHYLVCDCGCHRPALTLLKGTAT